ncbi:hypothetical protein [Dyadobacter sp. CY323]|uniref:hypothetical protein n=1 Tax=Dyadobacter sp. CY323 TaxID=2907302 RepID=UPI001F1ED156|nr:hypothetical protein [Dyadobacter sp. CY323]MCE6989892.1 hypothetical protein [Dyadobacter sp. CY323]
MSLYGKIVTLTFAITLGWSCTSLTQNLKAQGLGNSPYSSLGMGEFYGDAYSDQAGMGQSGVSYGSGFQVNNLNPALWVRNRFTTLDVGLIGQYKNIVAGSKNQNNAGGNLAYVSLSFPVSPKWAIGVNLKPYSFIDYENTSSRAVPGTPASAQYYTSGKGGINKASLTNSVQLTKYISLGLETSYFFGNVRKASEVTLGSGQVGDYVVTLNERTTYSDFSFRAGVAGRIPIKKENKLNLNLGGTYSFSSNLNSSQTRSFELTQESFPVMNPDTLENELGGGLTIPQQYQVGASLEWPFKLVLSADYSYQSWSKYRSFTNSNDNLKDVGRIHVGAEYLPRFTSLNYFNLVRYRVGFSHGNTPYSINGTDVKDTNVSLGFTFPMGRGYQNFISLALIAGQRGNTGAGLIRERYGRAVLGITLLERWFVKQKID